ncbi:MAG: RNA methyltransferase [Nocardioides sp.]|nr:RNA methyltransferase [Nocardioides sp.]
MQPLTASNARVKDARKLSRRSVRAERRLFLADGPKAVEGALGVDEVVVEVFATAGALEEHADLLESAPRVTVVDERALASLSDSVTPAGLVAVCRHFDAPLEHVVRASARLLVICADVRDPGNAGTVIRTADAAGADAVVLAGHSVDLYNPKTIRASVGSAFHLPIAVAPDPAAAVRAARARGLTVLAADGAGELGLYDADLTGPTAWLFGNEAWGLPQELAVLADHRVAIPIHGHAESLNLSTAAAVCLYASAAAQRG